MTSYVLDSETPCAETGITSSVEPGAPRDDPAPWRILPRPGAPARLAEAIFGPSERARLSELEAGDPRPRDVRVVELPAGALTRELNRPGRATAGLRRLARLAEAEFTADTPIRIALDERPFEAAAHVERRAGAGHRRDYRASRPLACLILPSARWILIEVRDSRLVRRFEDGRVQEERAEQSSTEVIRAPTAPAAGEESSPARTTTQSRTEPATVPRPRGASARARGLAGVGLRLLLLGLGLGLLLGPVREGLRYAALVRSFRNGPRPGARSELIDLARRYGPSLLIRAAESPAAPRRRNALITLEGLMRDGVGRETIVRLAKERVDAGDPLVIDAALAILARDGSVESRRTLIRATEHARPEVRRAAWRCLARTPLAVGDATVLAALTRETEPATRAALLRACGERPEAKGSAAIIRRLALESGSGRTAGLRRAARMALLALGREDRAETWASEARKSEPRKSPLGETGAPGSVRREAIEAALERRAEAAVRSLRSGS